MQINKEEFGAIELADVAAANPIEELKEFELALIGGGSGDISLG
jgi:hypothetical protein